MASKSTFPGVSIRMPVDKIKRTLKEATDKIASELPDIAEAVGLALLSDVQQDYRTKGRGDAGADGEKWPPIQIGTLLRRLRRTKQIGKLKPTDQKDTNAALASNRGKNVGSVFRLNKGHTAHDDLFTTLKKAGHVVILKAGRASKSDLKKRIAFGAGTVFGINRTKKGKTESVKNTLRQTITPQSGGYEIGVDRGLQINTLQPAKVNGDVGPNLVVSGNAVTVAAAMTYSAAFDHDRPIIPDPLPEKWLEGYGNIAAEAGANIVHVTFVKHEGEK